MRKSCFRMLLQSFIKEGTKNVETIIGHVLRPEIWTMGKNFSEMGKVFSVFSRKTTFRTTFRDGNSTQKFRLGLRESLEFLDFPFSFLEATWKFEIASFSFRFCLTCKHGLAFKCNTWSKFSIARNNIICPVHFASFVCKRRKIERNQIKTFSRFCFKFVVFFVIISIKRNKMILIETSFINSCHTISINRFDFFLWFVK